MGWWQGVSRRWTVVRRGDWGRTAANQPCSVPPAVPALFYSLEAGEGLTQGSMGHLCSGIYLPVPSLSLRFLTRKKDSESLLPRGAVAAEDVLGQKRGPGTTGHLGLFPPGDTSWGFGPLAWVFPASCGSGQRRGGQTLSLANTIPDFPRAVICSLVGPSPVLVSSGCRDKGP